MKEVVDNVCLTVFAVAIVVAFCWVITHGAGCTQHAADARLQATKRQMESVDKAIEKGGTVIVLPTTENVSRN